MATATQKKSTNVRVMKPSRALVLAGRAIGVLDRVSPPLAARLALWLWLRPRRFQRPAREQSFVDGAQPLVVPYGTGKLAGWTWGDPAAPTVALVHGWEGRGSQLAALVGPLVDAGFRVVTYDAPAHGESPGRLATLTTFADALAAVDRSVGPLYGVIAHSFGCAAAALALRSHAALDKVVFIAPSDVAQGVDRMARLLRLSDAARDEMRDQMARRFGLSLDDVSAAACVGPLRGQVLVIHDEDDRFAPVEDGEAFVAAASSGRLFRTRGLGHHRILRTPQVVDQVVAFMGGPAAGQAA